MKRKFGRQIEATRGWRWINMGEMFSYWEVLKTLIARDIKLRYTQTLLGVGWVILQPLITVGLFSIIFGKLMHLDSEGIPYMLFAFCGLIPWTFIYQGIQRAVSGIQNDRIIINKIYFPRLFIPLSSVVVSMIDVGILVIILGVLLKVFGLGVGWKVLFFPVCLMPLFCLTLGLGAFFSSLAVYYRDVTHLLPFFLQIFMYLSPVFYSSHTVPEKWLGLYQLNPMVGIIDACRWCFFTAGHFPMESFLIAAGLSLGLLVVGLFVFSQLEHYFADWI